MSRRSARKNAFYLLFQLGFTKSEEELLKQKHIFFQQIDEELRRKINEEEERIKLAKKKAVAELKAKQAVEQAIENSMKYSEEVENSKYDEEDINEENDEYEIDLNYEEDEDSENNENIQNIEIDEAEETDLESNKKSEEHEETVEISNTFLKKRKFQEITPDDKEFILKLVDGAVENIFDIDDIISENAKGWSASRMARVDITILRIAVFELVFLKETPVGVAINEAVELAKRFSSDEAPAFINGVLGSIARGE